MLHEEQMEEKRKKTRKRFRRGLQKWNVRRQRNVKLIGRGSERGPAESI